ncbi:MAG: DUF1624 domain-containing protein [Bdellovibrionaceae bacterium]|nr:DUF1624 domain-containing protein [Pseudobdellovibrionaceae bacterium]
MDYSSQVTHHNFNSERIFGLDLIRTLSFFTIASHHFVYSLWHIPLVFSPYRETSTIWYWFEAYARALSFSGQTILLMTTLLIAITATNHEKALRLVPIMLVLWVLSCYFDATPDSFFFAWDIFPLIALGLAGCFFIVRIFPKQPWVLPLLGLTLLAFPFWTFPSLQNLPLYTRHILIGDCHHDLSDWPVLPWIGLVFFGYGIGCLAKLHAARLRQFSWNEFYVWIPLLIWTPLYWGAYYSMRIGAHFSCDAMRQEPIAFLAHMFGILFVIRICFLKAVNEWLKKKCIVRFVSRLEININFGIAYFFHFILISGLIYLLNPSLARSPGLSFCVAFSLLPLTELSLRMLKQIVFRVKFFF